MPGQRAIRGLQFFKYTASQWVSRQSIAGINAGMDIAFRGKLRFNRGAPPAAGHESGEPQANACSAWFALSSDSCHRSREVDPGRQQQ